MHLHAQNSIRLQGLIFSVGAARSGLHVKLKCISLFQDIVKELVQMITETHMPL